MSAMAGKVASQVEFGLRFRVYVYRVKRNTAMMCLKSRDHTSSPFPRRYVPKTSGKVNDPGNSWTVKGVENRIFHKGLGGEVKSFHSGKKAQNGKQSELKGETNRDLAIMEYELMKETKEVIEETSMQHKKNLQSNKTLQDAEKLAVGLLATRAYTAVEMRKKLLGKRFSSNIVEAVVTNFQSRGLINDRLYAEMFSQSRWSSLSWGPGRIKQALFKKGVSEADAEKALKLVFENCESEDQESKFGLSKMSMDHLVVQASKQWLRGQDVPKETRKARIVRWLQYRGFNWGVTNFILKKLEESHNHS